MNNCLIRRYNAPRAAEVIVLEFRHKAKNNQLPGPPVTFSRRRCLSEKLPPTGVDPKMRAKMRYMEFQHNTLYQISTTDAFTQASVHMLTPMHDRSTTSIRFLNVNNDLSVTVLVDDIIRTVGAVYDESKKRKRQQSGCLIL